jgi:hypothetical protein
MISFWFHFIQSGIAVTFVSVSLHQGEMAKPATRLLVSVSFRFDLKLCFTRPFRSLPFWFLP